MLIRRGTSTRTTIGPASPSSGLSAITTNDGTRTLLAGGMLAGCVVGTAELAMTAASTPVGLVGLAILTIAGLGSMRELKQRHRDWRAADFGPAVGAHRELAAAIRTTMTMKIAGDPGMMRQSDATHALLVENSWHGSLEEYVGPWGIPQGKGQEFMLRMQDRVVRSLRIMEGFPADRSVGITRMEKFLGTIMEPYSALLHARHEPGATKGSIDPVRDASAPKALPPRMGSRESPTTITATVAARSNEAPHAPRSSWASMAEDLVRHCPEADAVVGDMMDIMTTLETGGADLLGDADRERLDGLVRKQIPEIAASYAKALELSPQEASEVRHLGLLALMPALHALREMRDACAGRARRELDAKARYMQASHPVAPEGLAPIP